jgi:IclR family transcriptional regulator, KDG regulon repressor
MSIFSTVLSCGPKEDLSECLKRRIGMNSFEKVTWLLKRLGEPPFEMGLSEMAKEIGTGRSGLFKIMGVLLKDNFVVQDPQTKKYSLGPVLFRLGNTFKQEKSILEIAEPHLRELAARSGESVGLCIREGDIAVLAHQIVSDQPLRFEGKIGSRLGPNRGAQGKLMAAYEPEERIREILLSTPLEARTPNTITDPERLFGEFSLIREQGFATSDEESFEGIRAIAAPVRNRHGEVWASLAIAGPTVRLTTNQVNEFLPIVIETADKISSGFGYRKQ